MGKECVEQALRAPRVLACEQCLLELGKHPDHVLSFQRVDEGLDAALELADVHRPRDDLRRRRLEDGWLGLQSIQRSTHERRLSDAVLPDQEDRSRRRLLERRDDELDELAPPAREECRRSVERPLPHAPDTRETPKRPPLLEALSKVRPELVVEAVDERLDLLHLAEGHALEGRGVDGLAARRSVANELRDELVTNRAQSREHRADDGRRGMDRERAQEKRVLAMGRTRNIACCPHDPLVRDVLAVGERDERHGGEPAVCVPAEANDLVDCEPPVRERFHALDERGLRLESLGRHVPPVELALEPSGGRAGDVACAFAVELEIRAPVVLRAAAPPLLDEFPDGGDEEEDADEGERDEHPVDDPVHVLRTVAPSESRVKAGFG